MFEFRAKVFILMILTALTSVAGQLSKAANNPGNWEQLDKGLEYAILDAPMKSSIGDSKIRVLRINPQHYSFHLVNASADDESTAMSVRGWAKKYDFVAAVNASMFQRDMRTSVSFMRNRSHVNNAKMTRDKTVFAVQSKDEKYRPPMIFDRECDDVETVAAHYSVLIQSIRMISCNGRNVWKEQKESWSTAAVAQDRSGNILFIHVQSPYRTHELIDHLLALPLNIRTAMYVEGGPQSQLFIKTPDQEHILLGRYTSELLGRAEAKIGWPVPNVIGIRKRSP